MAAENRQWLINGSPRGRAIEEDDFKYNEADLEALGAGQVRVKVEYLGFDPSQKGQIENIAGYSGKTQMGQVMGASGIGEVVESQSSALAVGAKVMGRLGWQDYATLPADALAELPNDEFLTAHLGPLGGTGLTAYFGLLRAGRPEPGDTLVVSGAAGAVGTVAGQIGKIAGCRVVGIAGGPAKCAWLEDELGFDAAIDYKAGRIKPLLNDHCPNGVDVFFDNVGGPILNDVLARIAVRARVVICGGISRYEMSELPPGPANYFNLVFRRATMQGILLTDYEAEFDLGRERMRGWIQSGQIKYKEDIQEGFDNIPRTLKRLFTGENFGKQLLRL